MKQERRAGAARAVQIREAAAAELAAVGELRVSAYRAGGFLPAGSQYAPMLRDLGADGADLVLVAVEPGRADRIVGTIMLERGPRTGEHVVGPEEAEIRALAVRPEAQGSGVGGLLLREVIGAARATGVRHLILCTAPEMLAARRLYERAGFVRLPKRDWSPAPHTSLLVYGLRLA